MCFFVSGVSLIQGGEKWRKKIQLFLCSRNSFNSSSNTHVLSPASWAHTRLHFRDCLIVRGAYDWALVNRMWMEMAYPSSNLSHLLLIKCRRFQDLENKGARWKESGFLGDYVEKRTTLFSTHLDCNVSLESNFCATWIWELFLHIISLHWRIRTAEFDYYILSPSFRNTIWLLVIG